MNRFILPGIAFFIVPLLLVVGGEAFARLPWIYAVLHRLPYLSVLPGLSFTYGMNTPDPAPLLAVAIGIGGFLLSAQCYVEALYYAALDADGPPTYRAALKPYLHLMAARSSFILGSATAVLLFAQWYLRLPLSLSLLVSLGVGYYLFRRVMSVPIAAIHQGVGQTTSEEVEARRRQEVEKHRGR